MTGERLATLQSFGLSENQSRVYAALLEVPVTGAGDLAKRAHVPRNRLYEVLEDLHELGLVDILLEEPRKYRARAIDEYLDRRVALLSQHIRDLESRAAATTDFRPRHDHVKRAEVGTTQVLMGRGTVAVQLDRLLARAERSILAASSLAGAPRVARHILGAPIERLDAKALIPASATGAAIDELIARAPAVVRRVDAVFGSLLFVVDEREMMLVHPVPDDDRMTSGRDFALLSDNPVFVRDFVTLARASLTASATALA